MRSAILRIGMLFGAMLLVGHWLLALQAVRAGKLFAYMNYWNAPVGTITLIVFLVVLTPIFVWAVWRYWNWQGYTAGKS